jgi:hypothetical protein
VVLWDQSLVDSDGGVFVLESKGQSILNFKDFYESTTNAVEMAEEVNVLRLQQKIFVIPLLTGITLSQNLYVANDLRGWLPNWVPRDYGKAFDPAEVQTAHQFDQLSAAWGERRFRRIAGHYFCPPESEALLGIGLKEVTASNALSRLFVKRRSDMLKVKLLKPRWML